MGISVSRVGGNAQVPAMKSCSTLKIEQAQYRELAFAQFSGDMDRVTMATLDKGQKMYNY